MATIPSTSIRIPENVTTHIQTAEQMSPTSLFKVHSQCLCTGGFKFLYAEHWSGIGFQTIHDVINHAHTADPPIQTRFSMSTEKLCTLESNLLVSNYAHTSFYTVTSNIQL